MFKAKIFFIILLIVFYGCRKRASHISVEPPINQDKLIFEGINNCDILKIKKGINNGSNINTQIKYHGIELTPLEIACYKCNKEFISLLIDHGADMNIESRTII